MLIIWTSIVSFFGKVNFKIIIVAALAIILIFGIKDYIESKQELKLEIENREKIIQVHQQELLYISDWIIESELQKNDLIKHNELLKKINKRKSNVDTKAKTFKSRSISKFVF